MTPADSAAKYAPMVGLLLEPGTSAGDRSAAELVFANSVLEDLGNDRQNYWRRLEIPDYPHDVIDKEAKANLVSLRLSRQAGNAGRLVTLLWVYDVLRRHAEPGPQQRVLDRLETYIRREFVVVGVPMPTDHAGFEAVARKYCMVRR